MKLADLFENLHPVPLRDDFASTLPPTYIMPELQNNDSYVQYRYIVALAAAEAVAKGEVKMEQESTWNENTSVVCYTPAEEQIVQNANKIMRVNAKKVSTTPSHEPKWINKASPVAKFRDYE